MEAFLTIPKPGANTHRYPLRSKRGIESQNPSTNSPDPILPVKDTQERGFFIGTSSSGNASTTIPQSLMVESSKNTSFVTTPGIDPNIPLPSVEMDSPMPRPNTVAHNAGSQRIILKRRRGGDDRDVLPPPGKRIRFVMANRGGEDGRVGTGRSISTIGTGRSISAVIEIKNTSAESQTRDALHDDVHDDIHHYVHPEIKLEDEGSSIIEDMQHNQVSNIAKDMQVANKRVGNIKDTLVKSVSEEIGRDWDPRFPPFHVNVEVQLRPRRIWCWEENGKTMVRIRF